MGPMWLRGWGDSGAEVTGAEVSGAEMVGAEVTRGRGSSGAEVSVNLWNTLSKMVTIGEKVGLISSWINFECKSEVDWNSGFKCVCYVTNLTAILGINLIILCINLDLTHS